VETSPPDIAPPAGEPDRAPPGPPAGDRHRASPGPAAAPPLQAKGVGGFFVLVMALFGFVGFAAQQFQPALGLLWSEAFVFMLPAGAAAAGSNLRPAPFLRLSPPPRPLHVVLGLGLGGALFLAAGGVMAITTLLLPKALVEAYDLAQLFKGPAWERTAVALVASLAAPLGEEAAFRGYVQSSLRTWLRPWPAVLLGALLFGVMHLDPVRFPAVLLLGVAFGWLTWRTGSLWPAVAAHAANNALGSGIALSGASDPTEQASLGPALAILAMGLALAAPLVLAVLRATPEPPPARGAVALRDPAHPSIRFRFSQVPAAYLAAGIVGMGLLFLLGVFGKPLPATPLAP